MRKLWAYLITGMDAWESDGKIWAEMDSLEAKEVVLRVQLVRKGKRLSHAVALEPEEAMKIGRLMQDLAATAIWNKTRKGMEENAHTVGDV